MNPDRIRASQRVRVEIPVYIGQQELVTRDVSRVGVYFLSDNLFAEGGDLNFILSLTYALPGKLIKFCCHGDVVRVEQHDGKYGIAAKINNIQLVH